MFIPCSSVAKVNSSSDWAWSPKPFLADHMGGSIGNFTIAYVKHGVGPEANGVCAKDASELILAADGDTQAMQVKLVDDQVLAAVNKELSDRKVHKKKKKNIFIPIADADGVDADAPENCSACKAPSLAELDKISAHLSNASFGGMKVKSFEAETVDGRIEVVAFHTGGWNKRSATLLGDAIRECLPVSVDFEVWGAMSS